MIAAWPPSSGSGSWSMDGATDGRPEFGRLLRALDTAAAADRALMAAPDEARPLSGLATALRLTYLLKEYRCSWADAILDDAILAKLCGRFGSEFSGEQEAAYVLAMRRVARRGVHWADIVHVPRALASRPSPAHVAEAPRPSAGASGVQSLYSAPEGDWVTTIDRLLVTCTWLTSNEQAWLRGLAEQSADGTPPATVDAVWLRDLWWQSELLTPLFDGRT